MPLDEYRADFQRHFWRIEEPGFWKLERQQHFKEPGNDSWAAFASGDWAEAMRLIESRRSSLADYYRRIAEQGFGTWRVRVVEEPITPYLQWELHLLRIRHECGGKVHVVDVEQVEHFEKVGSLPEIYTLGNDVMYQAEYDKDGVLQAGIRYQDRSLITRCQQFIQDLYEMGESLSSYFERRVVPLAAPGGE
ncbi:hypothetical protein A8926_2634 [Saccharopolyspora spinosa]|uniref:DUF6879 domain-containing protein n=2 Tax=Saccharopolyspora spinosa TaxID=60894 RepID=A0A2N3XWD0_SACSN|nr:hypothetical protein A8926_2634 [Saccharopolyspora spinosa]